VPGPVSESNKGPQDKVPFPPRWAYEHLTDEEYEALKTSPAVCPKCGGMRVHTRLRGYRCQRCD
jgi:hypothetical protein